MNEAQLSGGMSGLLVSATEGICGWLGDALPMLDQAWWSSLVRSNLSCQQRDRVERQGIESLRQLDLAALLRMMELGIVFERKDNCYFCSFFFWLIGKFGALERFLRQERTMGQEHG